MKISAFPLNPQSQSGAVLVVSLIILLILTILGVSVMQSTTLQEKMAAATRDKDLAFQAAEAALRAAEQRLETAKPASTEFVDACTNALCTVSDSGTPRWEAAAVWTDANSAATVAGIQGVSAAPKYIIEFLKTVNVGGDDLQQGNYQDIPLGKLVDYYRITAQGYGGSDNSRVMLQATYAIAQ